MARKHPAQPRQTVREMIGRTASPYISTAFYAPITVDPSRSDYAFWDHLRRGKKADYAIGALFAQPIARSLTAWTYGKGFTVETDDAVGDTEATLNTFIADNLITFIRTTRDCLSLGDTYLVINADGSLTRVSPDTVEVLTEPVGSQHVVGYRITTRLFAETVIDEYRMEGRTCTVIDAQGKRVETYPNLIGLIPVIPWHWNPASNEVYGHPYYEPLLKLFNRYDRTFNKALDGVDVMGNPIPTVEGADDPQETLKLLSGGRTHTYIDEDGNTQEQYVVDFSRLAVAVLGKGASLKFAAPGSFTQDAGRMLEYLFLLMLQATGIPEWVWGGAIASSKASVDAQMPAFERLIDGLRLELTAPIRQTLRVWLAYTSLYTSRLDPQADIALHFASIVTDDRTQKLAEVTFAREDGEITQETALRLLDLVDDPAAEVEDAQAEADEKAKAGQDPMDAALINLLKQEQQPPQQSPDEMPMRGDKQAA